jgi:hypothetical protein
MDISLNTEKLTYSTNGAYFNESRTSKINFILRNKPFKNGFTLSFWIKNTVYPYANTKMDLFNIGNDIIASDYLYCWPNLSLNPYLNGQQQVININYGNNSSIVSFINNPLNIIYYNTWLHIIITIDTNNNYKCYINNILAASYSGNSSDLGFYNIENVRFLLGYRNSNRSWFMNYIGYMDEIKIYKYNVNESFINNLYISGHTSNTLLSIDDKIYLDKNGIINGIVNEIELITESLTFSNNGAYYSNLITGKISFLLKDKPFKNFT